MNDSTTRDPSLVKTCTQCGESKPATTEYYRRDKRCGDGLHYWCKECKAERQRAYREANREALAEYSRAYHAANRETRAEYRRAYREANREALAEYDRAYQAANREAVKAKHQRRRARKRNAEGNHTAEDIKAQYKAQRGRCYYAACGHSKLDDNYHVDHIVPLSRGGSNGPENLVIACAFCNWSKNDKLPSEWPQGGRLL